MRLLAPVCLALLLAGCSAPAAEVAPTSDASSQNATAAAGDAGLETPAFPCARAFRGSAWTSEDTHDAIADLGTIVKPEGIRGPDPVPRDARVVAVRKDLPFEDRPQEEAFFGDFEAIFVDVDPFATAYLEARFEEGNWTLAAHDLGREVDLGEQRATIRTFVTNVTNATDAEVDAAVDALLGAQSKDEAGPVPMPRVTTEALREVAANEDTSSGFGSLHMGGEREATAQAHDLQLRYLVPRALHVVETPTALYELSANERGEVEILAELANASDLDGTAAEDVIRRVAREVAPLEIPELDVREVLDMRWLEIDCGETDPEGGAPVRVTLQYDECAMAVDGAFQHDGVYGALPAFGDDDAGIAAPAQLGLPQGARVMRIVNASEFGQVSLASPWWEGDAWSLEVESREEPRESLHARVSSFLRVTLGANDSQIESLLASLDERIAVEAPEGMFVSVELDAPTPALEALDAFLGAHGAGRGQAMGMSSVRIDFGVSDPANASGAPPGFIPWIEPSASAPWQWYVDVPLRQDNVALDGGRLSLTAGGFGAVRARLAQDAPASLAPDEDSLVARWKQELVALGLPGLDETALEGVETDTSCGYSS